MCAGSQAAEPDPSGLMLCQLLKKYFFLTAFLLTGNRFSAVLTTYNDYTTEHNRPFVSTLNSILNVNFMIQNIQQFDLLTRQTLD